MKIVGPLKETLEKLENHHKATKAFEEQLIRSLFEQFPSLHSFELESVDSDPKPVLRLVKVNGISWEEEEDSDLEYLYYESDNVNHNSWLVEANLKAEEFKAFLLALRRLDTLNWDTNLEFKRKKFQKPRRMEECLTRLLQHNEETDKIVSERRGVEHQLEMDLIESLFFDIAQLKSLSVGLKETYGYNGYYEGDLQLVELNGVSLLDQGLSTEIEFLDSNLGRNELKSWLVEAEFHEDEMKKIIKALSEVGKYSFSEKKTFVREEIEGINEGAN